MRFSKYSLLFFNALCLTALLLLTAAPASAQETRTIIDMRGKEVTFPAELTRIATIDDGFVEQVMTHLGVVDKVTAIASWSMKRDYRYAFSTTAGAKYEHQGWNTMKFLHPWLNDLPCFNSPQGNVLNFETLASVNPELVIMRAGDCTVRRENPENAAKAMETIESLNIPLVVIYAPGLAQGSGVSGMRQEMGVLGDIFGQKQKALALADKLAETELMIIERTKGITQKTRMLYLGLNPDVRKKGAAGSVFGINTPESYLIENIAHAENAYQGKGFGVPMSVEQIYALDPDVIVLPTHNGYHPPREIYEAPYFAALNELQAIQNRRVYAMPWTPMNCARRMEYPLDMLIIAKAAYPEKFKAVNVYDFALRFYQEVYGVSEEQAKGLRSTQILDWMKEYDF